MAAKLFNSLDTNSNLGSRKDHAIPHTTQLFQALTLFFEPNFLDPIFISGSQTSLREVLLKFGTIWETKKICISRSTIHPKLSKIKNHEEIQETTLKK